MRFWTKSLTSPRTDEKIRVAGLYALLGGIIIAGLAFWTYLVFGRHGIEYALASWSKGSRGPGRWELFIVVWLIPLLIGTLLSLMIHASKAKKKRF